MDNATSHTAKKTRDYMAKCGLKVFDYEGSPTNHPTGYPPNSPDINPIESVFSYWNDLLAKRRATTVENMKKTYVGMFQTSSV